MKLLHFNQKDNDRKDIDLLKKHHPQQSISLNEFFKLLSDHHYKFYSQEQVKKMCRLFNNTWQTIKTDTALNWIEVVGHHKTPSGTHHIIKTTGRKTLTGHFKTIKNAYIPQKHSNGYKVEKLQEEGNVHSQSQCVEAFMKRMLARYGNPTTWFQALTGLTISLQIHWDQFKQRAVKIMRNSYHRTCIENIWIYFGGTYEENISQGVLEYKTFMENIRKLKQKSKQQKSQKVDSKNQKNQRSSSNFLLKSDRERGLPAYNSKLSLRVRTIHTSEVSQINKNSVILKTLPDFEYSPHRNNSHHHTMSSFSTNSPLHLSLKKCILHTRTETTSLSLTCSMGAQKQKEQKEKVHKHYHTVKSRRAWTSECRWRKNTNEKH